MHNVNTKEHHRTVTANDKTLTLIISDEMRKFVNMPTGILTNCSRTRIQVKLAVWHALLQADYVTNKSGHLFGGNYPHIWRKHTLFRRTLYQQASANLRGRGGPSKICSGDLWVPCPGILRLLSQKQVLYLHYSQRSWPRQRRCILMKRRRRRKNTELTYSRMNRGGTSEKEGEKKRREGWKRLEKRRTT